ncbi:Chitinase (EC 3.2.1.14) [Spiroplasma endosymbiont of Danaus chrysippus]|nr:Chitinase (EC 3.2.1.14) [Spiroplasma endosymbiont of Danaus chrysippus]
MWIIDHNITDIDNAINKIINKLDEDLTELINKNIKKIVMTNIPDMGLIPNYKETINQQPMTNLVNKFNLKLNEEITKLNKDFEKTNIKEYDVFSKFNNLFQQFKNRGSQYKDSNATTIDINTLGKKGILQPQYVSGANSQNIDNYFFLNKFHPTKWVQEQIANDLYNFLYKFNNKNQFEVDYRAAAHDWIKVKISYDNFLHIQNIYNTEKQENFKQLFFEIINKLPKENDTGLGGSISQDDIYTAIKVIIDHFQEINNFFKTLPEDQGIRIITNRIGSWDKGDSMGVFNQ